MVVGSTGGGKTVIINTLIKVQCDLGIPTKCTVLNPKVCSIFIHPNRDYNDNDDDDDGDGGDDNTTTLATMTTNKYHEKKWDEYCGNV